MRSLPVAITTEKDKTSCSPWYVLEIVFPSGTQRYSSRDLSAFFTPAPIVAIVDWGVLSSEVQVEDDEPSMTDISLTLQDNTSTGAILAKIRNDGVEGLTATVKVGFDGSGATLFDLFVGRISSPVSYNQELRRATITIASLFAMHDTELGYIASRSQFADIAPRDNGRMLPIVYGAKVKSVEAVQIVESPRTSLAGRITASATTLIVTDGSRFPQGVPVTIRIGYELITGSFSGNLFNATIRGDVFLSGRITDNLPANGWYLLDSTLNNYPDNYFNNMFVQIAYPAPYGTQNRIITSYDGNLGAVYFTPPFSNASAGIVQPGTVYSIITWPWIHEAGEEVVLHLPLYTWIAADSPAGVVDIYLETNLKDTGRAILPQRTYVVNPADTGLISGKTVCSITTAWEPLQAVGQYTGSMIGLPLTLLTLGPKPYSSNRMFCDVSQGMSHPAEIISDVLLTRLKLAPAEVDAASFVAVQIATPTYAFGFALTEQIRGIEMVGQLCFQSACTITFDRGAARLHQLTMTHTPVKAISREEVSDDSPVVERREFTDIVNTIIGLYIVDGEEYTVTAVDASSVSDFKEHAKTIELWAINNTRMARYIAYFWLFMYNYPYELLVIDVFLPELELEPLDDITLSDILVMSPDQVARVMRVDHHLGGESSGIDRISLTLRVPVRKGCQNGCETICEVAHDEDVCTLSGCEVGCEITCQYACEASCQQFCQLGGCTAGCETGCMAAGQACMQFIEVGCDPNVETGCDPGIEGGGCGVDLV